MLKEDQNFTSSDGTSSLKFKKCEEKMKITYNNDTTLSLNF
jgi:hypothetical protein